MEQPEAPPQSRPLRPPASASQKALQRSKPPPSPTLCAPSRASAGIERVVSLIAAMRDAVGPAIDIAIDFHRATSPALAKVLLRELEPLRPLFVEEPTRSTDNIGPLLELTRSTSIPIATGERCATRWGFRELCERKAAAIIQPDIRHCGGLLEMKKIAALAEVHEIAVAPHNAADPLGVVASVQAMAGTPNFLIMEYGGGGGKGFFTNPLQMKDGFVELPRGPGLGVKIDPEGLEAATHRGPWRQRTMRRHPEDGSFADF